MASQFRALCVERFLRDAAEAGVDGLTIVDLTPGHHKAYTTLPIAVGFGICTAEHAAAIGRISEAVVVGSALVECIEHAETPGDAKEGVHARTRELAEGTRQAR